MERKVEREVLMGVWLGGGGVEKKNVVGPRCFSLGPPKISCQNWEKNEGRKQKPQNG